MMQIASASTENQPGKTRRKVKTVATNGPSFEVFKLGSFKISLAQTRAWLELESSQNNRYQD